MADQHECGKWMGSDFSEGVGYIYSSQLHHDSQANLPLTKVIKVVDLPTEKKKNPIWSAAKSCDVFLRWSVLTGSICSGHEHWNLYGTLWHCWRSYTSRRFNNRSIWIINICTYYLLIDLFSKHEVTFLSFWGDEMSITVTHQLVSRKITMCVCIATLWVYSVSSSLSSLLPSLYRKYMNSIFEWPV